MDSTDCIRSLLFCSLLSTVQNGYLWKRDNTFVVETENKSNISYELRANWLCIYPLYLVLYLMTATIIAWFLFAFAYWCACCNFLRLDNTQKWCLKWIVWCATPHYHYHLNFWMDSKIKTNHWFNHLNDLLIKTKI